MSLINQIKKEIGELKQKQSQKEPSKQTIALFKKKEEINKREAIINEYDVLVKAGVIEPVIIPPNTVNLIPYLSEEHKRVKEALKDPKNQEIIDKAQEEANRIAEQYKIKED